MLSLLAYIFLNDPPPKVFIREVVIPQMNKNMSEGEQVLTYGEFLVWIGLWFMMATIQGF